jgi:hypothetical protein
VALDDDESAPVRVSAVVSLDRQVGVAVRDGEADSSSVRGHGQFDVGTGVSRRVGDKFSDHKACRRDEPAQSPVQQGPADEVS